MSEILQNFLNYISTIKGCSPGTVGEYTSDLKLFFRFIKCYKNNLKIDTGFKEIDISDVGISEIKSITLNDLYAYMAFLSNIKNNKPESRARKTASLKSFFKYLVNKAKLIEYNPASELESPKVQKSLPKYLSIEESKQLLKSIEGEHKERDYAIIVFFLNCGLRLSELVNIDINKIRQDTLTVIGKGNKERTIYLNTACKQALSDYLKVRQVHGIKDKEALFLSERKQRISIKTVQHIVKKYLKMAGLDAKKYSTHKLRHTAATLMYKYGKVDIRSLQEILGHESVSTTEIYTHIDSSQLKNAVDRNPLANFTSKSEE